MTQAWGAVPYAQATDPALTSPVVPGQLWVDTSTEPPVTKMRNQGNTGWDAVGGGGGAGAAKIIGPFTVNWNDANVTGTGVALWTPSIGDIVYDIWAEITTQWNASAPADTIQPSLVAGLQTIKNGNAELFGTAAASGATYRQAFLSLTQDVPGSKPLRFIAAAPIKCIINLVDGGTLTAGQLKFYALATQA